MFIPLKNISLRELENEYYWVVDKVAYILFSGRFNNYALTKTRSILDFVVENEMITPKQIKLIKDLNPSKTK